MSVRTPNLRIALTDELLAHAEAVAHLFLQAMFKTIGTEMLEELSEAEVTYPQMQAMRYLMTHRRVTIGDLVEGLQISYPSATNMVNRLERKKLVRRFSNPRDRRQVGIQLTPAGADLIKRLDQERKQRFALILAHMSESERQAFIQGLHAFVRTGLQHEILPAENICLHCGSARDPLCPIIETISPEFCR